MTSTVISPETSRVFGVAKALAGEKLNAEVAYSRRVILTGDSSTLTTENGRWCFVDSLRLLCRVFGDVQIVLPPGVDPEFRQLVNRLCETLWSRGKLVLLQDSLLPDHANAHAVLNIGSDCSENLLCTSINSNGWVARVNSGPGSLNAQCDQPNPIAALMAAALGVTEVFKRVFEVSRDVAPLLGVTEFSLFELSTTAGDHGPELPKSLLISDTILFGAGAIGNAIALLLSQLPLYGRLHVVDKQNYAPENTETCTQMEKTGWVGEEKGPRLALWLETNSLLRVTGEKATIADAIDGQMIRSLNVDLVLNGLDDVQARHDTQRLWSAVTIDGGINQIGAAVVQHRLFRPEMACLLCSFELPDENLQTTERRATGLNLSAAESRDRVITDADVAKADPEHRAWLRGMVKAKRTVCSVISEGVKLLQLNADKDFQPSAPFVAAASAALVVSELVKAMCSPERPPTQQFVLGNLFLGPEASLELERAPNGGCRCVRHRETLEKNFARRRALSEQGPIYSMPPT